MLDSWYIVESEDCVNWFVDNVVQIALSAILNITLVDFGLILRFFAEYSDHLFSGFCFCVEMDPIHLQPSELDYEVELRGVFNLSTSRQKTQCLREFLRREQEGERTISAERMELLNPKAEIAICDSIFSNIMAKMLSPELGSSVMSECRSRLIHIVNRLKRAKAVTPEDQTHVLGLIDAATNQLSQLSEVDARRPNAFRSSGRVTITNEATGGPIQEVGRRIEEQRLANASRPSGRVTSVNGAVGFSRQSAAMEQRSSLNPNVIEFLPKSYVASQPPLTFEQQRSTYPIFATTRAFEAEQLGSRQNDNRGQATYNVGSDYADSHFSSRVPSPLPRDYVEVDQNRVQDADRNVHQRNAGEQAMYRNFRKPVPIHQWRISYSGENSAMHLYDFLSEVQMFQRAENVSDDDVLASIMHLLTGRARLWYRSWFDTFRCWNDFVVGIKKEFLPPKYDYRLLTNISNRRQKPNETFAEFLNSMQTMFKYLSIPINEQHKLCIIEENMLSKYAVAASTVEIVSLEQLSNICRRMDFAYSKQTQPMPLEEKPLANRWPIRANATRPREVCEFDLFDATENVAQSFVALSVGEACDKRAQNAAGAVHTPEHEVCEVRKGGEREKRPEDARKRRCFNCDRDGHTFGECKMERKGSFCYRCGSKDVTVFNCPQCSKNGQQDAVPVGGGSKPRPQ